MTGIDITMADTRSQPVTSYTGMQGKILEMLGNGLSPEVASSALGVSPGYISQLVSTEEFARQVAERRFTNLQASTARDRRYDSLEDKLADKLEDLLPMMFKPMEIIRALATINSLKRRGASAPENTVINQTIVQLTLPTALTSRFVTDSANQVVAAGDQDLITIKSTQLSAKLVSSTQATQIPQLLKERLSHVTDSILGSEF
jgi:hypothetical protein